MGIDTLDQMLVQSTIDTAPLCAELVEGEIPVLKEREKLPLAKIYPIILGKYDQAVVEDDPYSMLLNIGAFSYLRWVYWREIEEEGLHAEVNNCIDNCYDYAVQALYNDNLGPIKDTDVAFLMRLAINRITPTIPEPDDATSLADSVKVTRTDINEFTTYVDNLSFNQASSVKDLMIALRTAEFLRDFGSRYNYTPNQYGSTTSRLDLAHNNQTKPVDDETIEIPAGEGTFLAQLAYNRVTNNEALEGRSDIIIFNDMYGELGYLLEIACGTIPQRRKDRQAIIDTLAALHFTPKEYIISAYRKVEKYYSSLPALENEERD